MRFEIFRNAGLYAFRLLDNNVQALLNSPGYRSPDECTTAIRRFVLAASEAGNFVSAGKNSFLVQENGETLATAVEFNSRRAATAAITDILAALSGTTDYEVILTETRTRLRQVPATDANAYNFSLISFSGKPGFDAFQNPQDSQYYFFFNDAAAKEFFYSQPYLTASARNHAIRSVIRFAKNKKRYQVVEENGSFYFILTSGNGQEIARSRSYGNRTDLENAMTYLHTTVGNFEEQYKKPEKTTRAGRIPRLTENDTYDFSVKSKSRTSGFETLENKENKKQYFHFNDAKGKAILYSQAYQGIAGRDIGIKSVIKNAAAQANYERNEENGKFYFILKAGNGQEIARSPHFDSAKELEKAIVFLKENAITYAQKYKVKLTTQPLTTTQTRTFNIHIDRPEAKVIAYDFTQPSASGKKGFELFKNENNKFYFHFNNEEGKSVLFSPAYDSATERKSGIKAVIKGSLLKKRWSSLEDKGRFYYFLTGKDETELARSPLFESREKMLAGLEYVQKSSVDYAGEFGIKITTPATPNTAGLAGIKEETADPLLLPVPMEEAISEPLLEEVNIHLPLAEEVLPELPEPETLPIPAKEPVLEKMPPVALDVVNGEISGRAGAVSIKSLAGKDADGKVVSYTLLSLPAAEKGILLLNDTPVHENQVLTHAQAGHLRFDPSGKSAGNAVFSYKVTNDAGLESNTALFTIPVMNVPPTAKNIAFGTIKSNAGAIKIDPLQATDSDGSIDKYIITALPPVSHGTLLLRSMPVKEQQQISPADLPELAFIPDTAFEGIATFQYKAVDDNHLFSNVADYTIEVEKEVIAFIPPIVPVVPVLEIPPATPVSGLVPPLAEVVKTPEPLVAEPVVRVIEPIMPVAELITPLAEIVPPPVIIPMLPVADPPIYVTQPVKPVEEVVKPVMVGEPVKPVVAAEPIAEEKARGGILPWLLGAAALLALGFGIWWMMNRPPEVPATPVVNNPAVVLPNTETTLPAANTAPIAPTLENFQPINLYFNNDSPDPRTEAETTPLTYPQTYLAYYQLKNQFAGEYSKGLLGADAGNARTQVSDFFDGKVKKGYEDLLALSEKLLAKLKDGNKVEITVTGFASPLAASEYNRKLTSRRVSSIENHFRTYKNGQFKAYMDNKMLLITEKDSGEEAASQSISDDRTDVRNSWYSPSASAERRVEITNVTVTKP